jgi:hypothetical protein
LVQRSISQDDVVGVVGSMADVTETWYGAIASILAAMVGFLGLWLVPKWAKKTELARADSGLMVDADVKSRADLILGFNQLLLSQQKRIDQIGQQLDESVTDRVSLWERVEKLTDELSECEKRNSAQALTHFVEITAVKTQLSDCQRDLVDLKKKI